MKPRKTFSPEDIFGKVMCVAGRAKNVHPHCQGKRKQEYMAVHINIDLTDSQKTAMAAIPAASWFSQLVFRNAESPVHPNPLLAENNDMKMAMVSGWIERAVKGKRVLDLFSANGGVSFFAALCGAKEVVGVEYAADRVECAEFAAGFVRPHVSCRIEFIQADVYDIATRFQQPFDVVLCLGGLYHIADPAYILRQIRHLTAERMILQTSQVLNCSGNRAKFVVRRKDKTASGMSSIRGGYGTWHYSPACLRELLFHGGFEIVEDRQPPLLKRCRFPWYLADCTPL